MRKMYDFDSLLQSTKRWEGDEVVMHIIISTCLSLLPHYNMANALESAPLQKNLNRSF